MISFCTTMWEGVPNPHDVAPPSTCCWTCLVQGRGQGSHAYTHSLEHGHHVYMKLETGKVCDNLPSKVSVKYLVRKHSAHTHCGYQSTNPDVNIHTGQCGCRRWRRHATVSRRVTFGLCSCFCLCTSPLLTILRTRTDRPVVWATNQRFQACCPERLGLVNPGLCRCTACLTATRSRTAPWTTCGTCSTRGSQQRSWSTSTRAARGRAPWTASTTCPASSAWTTWRWTTTPTSWFSPWCASCPSGGSSARSTNATRQVASACATAWVFCRGFDGWCQAFEQLIQPARLRVEIFLTKRK